MAMIPNGFLGLLTKVGLVLALPKVADVTAHAIAEANPDSETARVIAEKAHGVSEFESNVGRRIWSAAGPIIDKGAHKATEQIDRLTDENGSSTPQSSESGAPPPNNPTSRYPFAPHVPPAAARPAPGVSVPPPASRTHSSNQTTDTGSDPIQLASADTTANDASPPGPDASLRVGRPIGLAPAYIYQPGSGAFAYGGSGFHNNIQLHEGRWGRYGAGYAPRYYPGTRVHGLFSDWQAGPTGLLTPASGPDAGSGYAPAPHYVSGPQQQSTGPNQTQTAPTGRFTSGAGEAQPGTQTTGNVPLAAHSENLGQTSGHVQVATPSQRPPRQSLRSTTTADLNAAQLYEIDKLSPDNGATRVITRSIAKDGKPMESDGLRNMDPDAFKTIEDSSAWMKTQVWQDKTDGTAPITAVKQTNLAPPKAKPHVTPGRPH